MICEYFDSCTLIRHMSRIVPFTLNMAKIKYCESNKYACVRYGLAQVVDPEELPHDLWPGDEQWALEIMEQGIRKECRSVGNFTG
jgi:hypothetical protein